MLQAMHNKSYSHPVLLLFVLLLTCTFLSSSTISQTADSEKPKLNDFGSSLKRLKWDPKLKASVGIEDSDTKVKRENRTSDPATIRVETALVLADYLVVDKGGTPVLGLQQNDFVLNEDSVPQQVAMFALGNSGEIRRSIVLIIDYSGSLFRYVNTSVEAAKTLVDQLGPKDKMAIVTDAIELLADFTKNKTELKSKLDLLKLKAQDAAARDGWGSGHSLQLSALLAVLKEAFDTEDVRPIVIFQTDGDEMKILQPQPSAFKKIARPFSFSDVYDAGVKSRATIYTVLPGPRVLGLPRDKQIERIKARDAKIPQFLLERERIMLLQEQSALASLSIATGGWMDFLEEPSQAAAIYSRIFLDISLRYVIGYYPTNKDHDGKKRKISIEVKGHPEYTVLGRKAYYAPGSER
jgi:VWFA-related protein